MLNHTSTKYLENVINQDNSKDDEYTRSQNEKMALMELWFKKKMADTHLNIKFPLEKWVKVSEQERLNLLYLDTLK